MVLASYVSAGLTQTRADGGAVRALLYLDHENRENSAKTACDPAVFPIAKPRQPRISAENAIAPADNFVQKQQKQQKNGNYRPADILRIL
jgi:hypothetical protein